MPINFAKMVAIAETLETVTNVFVPMDTREVTAKKKLMSVPPTLARMEPLAKISLALTNASARKDTKARIANSISTIVNPILARIMESVMISLTTSDAHVLMEPLESYVKSISTNVLKEHVITEEPVLTKLVSDFNECNVQHNLLIISLFLLFRRIRLQMSRWFCRSKV